MSDVEKTVYRVLQRIVAERSPGVAKIESTQRLTSDLGLKSLDVARLIAVLELEIGVDPFVKLVAITDVRTVGDLCAAYRKALSDDPNTIPETTIEPSRQRAEARRKAQYPRRDRRSGPERQE